ncbi:hypothetical protein HJ015_02995 [Vibrio parahaemolyticus]|uniref:restriction endonuclease subunit S n=1 Tax=Vibrio parahaemolyticus TaxID=670 RepID=UPI00111CC112|nr:restriction endonuclease subunit S [Vibrio parahaemolyticus]MBE4445879.1 hypothetical protein [Vibrio parahaemolyticus]TOD75658.1 hypothetical protein CGJ57_17270 [Vibrio parahaemolyticus]HCM0679577.1 restriction endonuclease subunit S [Vibrio parahaemolyticus]
MSELPKGWFETTLGDVATWSSGGTPSRKNKDYYNGNIPWIKTGDLGAQYLEQASEYISDEGLKNSSAKLFPKNTVAIAMYGATIGKTSILNFEATTNQACGVAIPNASLSTVFLYYLLRNEKEGFIARGKGGAQPNISQTIIKEYSIWLPPLNEQIRIANKLDSILAKVDKAQARLDKIPAILKRFRQSVLAAATSGELTKEWRESKDLHWEVTSFGKLIKNGPQNGIYKPSKLYGSGTKIIRIDGFYDGKLSPWESIKSVQLENDELAKWKLKVDDILINRVNSIEYLGKCGHVDCLPEDAVFESNIMRVELDKSLANPLFIKHFLSSPIGLMRLRANAKHAVNQASINQTDVKSVEIQLPSIEEQKLIAELVEAFLDKANKVEKQYLEAKSRLDRLTQSILAKAFRGELVPQDPNDEPAEKLLERILAEKEQSKPKKTTRKRTTKAKTAEKE